MLLSTTAVAGADEMVLRLGDGAEISLERMSGKLARARVIVVGESHTNQAHHRLQLEIIKSLAAAGVRLAVGLEMFERKNQADLDHWVAGRIDEASFEKLYLENWNLPWRLYRPIFVYARERRLPLIGLNIDPDLARAVARRGLSVLSPEQVRELTQPPCPPPEAYQNLLRDQLQAHDHGRMNFDDFMAAQTLRDGFMARTALAYLSTDPNRTLVVLTGSVHAWKPALPRQLACLGQKSVKVVLPAEAGVFPDEGPTSADADYVWLGERPEEDDSESVGPP